MTKRVCLVFDFDISMKIERENILASVFVCFCVHETLDTSVYFKCIIFFFLNNNCNVGDVNSDE